MKNHTRHHNNIISSIKHNPNNARLLTVALLSFVAGAFLMFVVSNDKSSSNPLSYYPLSTTTSTTIQQEAILHYATSEIVPQQSLAEIMQSFNVLRTTAPCNFLVFGLGYDSLMWAALNPNGTTLFLEESDEWVTSVLKDAPFLQAKTVSYRTHLSNATWLLKTYRDNPDCRPSKGLKGNTGCPLALESLPDEVYEREWDVIMIDAPRGYEPEFPGRMAAIYSMAVMARARTRPGNTHVYLHDVNRPAEKTFGMEFLCEKYKVGGVGRIWHFEIPPVRDNVGDDATFC